jgi:hypothetical protein
VGALELGVAVDRDLAELESELDAKRLELAAGQLAEVAARRGVEGDRAQG